MNIYLLKPIDISSGTSLWKPWFDKCFGFVIRAESEKQAREFAAENAGDEKRDKIVNPWLDFKQTSCEILQSEGPIGLVLQDFKSA